MSTKQIQIPNQTVQQQQTQQVDKNSWEFYFRTGLLGAFRGFCGLPFEHPFDVLKTRLQANSMIPKKYANTPQFVQLQDTSMFSNWNQIYKQQGLFRGVYAGYLPSLARVMSKQFYRFPMMIYFPQKFKQIMPQSISQKYDGSHKVMAGLTIACLETLIICPLERLKVFLMTKQQSQSFFKPKQQMLKQLYQGVDALFYRQITSWVSFLYLDYKVKKVYKEMKGLEVNQAISDTELIACSSVIGVANVLIVQPFDKIKTIMQMQGNESYVKKSIVQNMNKVYNTQGMKGMYSGIKPRMIHYVVNSIFTCSVMEKLELTVLNNNNKQN